MKTVLLALAISLTSIQANAVVYREAILGFTVDEVGITYQVESSGCTSKSDFELDHLESFPMQLVLRRVQFDACDVYLPYGTKITYAWGEINADFGMELIIANPIKNIVYLGGIQDASHAGKAPGTVYRQR
jgi:hypothetical protein